MLIECVHQIEHCDDDDDDDDDDERERERERGLTEASTHHMAGASATRQPLLAHAQTAHTIPRDHP